MRKKLLALFMAFGIAFGLAGCSGVDTGFGKERITFFTGPGWEDTGSLTELWVQLLEERDIVMDVTTVDLAAGFASISKGSLDGYLNTWLPVTHKSYLEKNKDDFVILNGENGFYDDNLLLFAVPDYSEAESFQDVVDEPEEFDSKIIGIEAGAGMMDALPEVLEKYDASDKLDVIPGSTPAMLACLQRAIDRKEEIVVTLWKPHWSFESMPIRALEDPKHGWPEPDSSHVVVSKKFAEEYPHITGWMNNMHLTGEQFNSLMLEATEAETMREGVKKWLENPENRKLTDTWFEEN